MSPEPLFLRLVSSAAAALKERQDDVNRLNVFPVPDGDTGTNMSLTMDSVLEELATLPTDADVATVCKAITHGSLMGARGNSGVILSQILRGVCDVVGEATRLDPRTVADALDRARVVAFQAVRKPVEGTMLTVLKDAAVAARKGVKSGLGLEELLDHVMNATFESVKRTTELLPVLKENNVVDAGGYGLAILAEGLVAAYKGEAISVPDLTTAPAILHAEAAEDWADQKYLYCTEFLFFADEDTDSDVLTDYVAGMGDSELVVGGGTEWKVHVHTNEPAAVLAHMTSMGEVAEVHINNMRRQTAQRGAAIREESASGGPRPPFGVVTVATGSGLREILESLGADVVVNGGQTMNPSTAELLEAAGRLRADHVIFLPNNRNIQMAAQQAAEMSEVPAGVVPTRSVPEAFAALLAFDPEADLDTNLVAMTEAASAVRTAEVTTAVKDSNAKAGHVKKGQFIGIVDHEIEVIGDDLLDVTAKVVDLIAQDAEVLTVLAGADLDDATTDRLVARLREEHPETEVEAHRGEQPLYPVIVSAE